MADKFDSHKFTQDPLDVTISHAYPDHDETYNNRKKTKKTVVVSPQPPQKLRVQPTKTRPYSTSMDTESTPLLHPSSSLPTVVGYDEINDEYPGPSNRTRSEIGRKELSRRRKQKKNRSDTLQSSTKHRKPRPLIISPFMPISTQISIDKPRQKTYTNQEPRDVAENLLPKSSSEDESSSGSEDDSEVSENEGKGFWSSLTNRQIMTIAMLSLSNICSTIAFSCIAPFYPAEAKLKNLTETEIGIVFGIFEFTMFLISPVFGKYIIKLGARRLFVGGIFMTGVTAILFGFLNYLPAGRIFFWASVTVRIVEALGDAAFVTSSFAIAARGFPKNVGFMIGLLETFAGLGYTAGPLIGGFFYDIGGFQLPFLVLGGVLMVATVFAFLLIDNQPDVCEKNKKGMLDMLKIPSFWLPLFAVIFCAISLSFLDPTLAEHLSQFELSPTQVGLMFLLCGGFYTFFCTLFGTFIDEYDCGSILLIFGSLSTLVSMILVGPTPLLGNILPSNIWLNSISLAILGVAASAMYIPCFNMCLNESFANHFPDNFRTYGCVSGIFQSAFGLGSFIGPVLGSVVSEKIGFAWTTTIIAGLHVFLTILLCIGAASKACAARRTAG